MFHDGGRPIASQLNSLLSLRAHSIMAWRSRDGSAARPHNFAQPPRALVVNRKRHKRQIH
jgi:hypothetical protein